MKGRGRNTPAAPPPRFFLTGELRMMGRGRNTPAGPQPRSFFTGELRMMGRGRNTPAGPPPRSFFTAGLGMMGRGRNTPAAPPPRFFLTDGHGVISRGRDTPPGPPPRSFFTAGLGMMRSGRNTLAAPPPRPLFTGVLEMTRRGRDTPPGPPPRSHFTGVLGMMRRGRNPLAAPPPRSFLTGGIEMTSRGWNPPAGPPPRSFLTGGFRMTRRGRYSTQTLLESSRVAPAALARGRGRGWFTWKLQVACAAVLLPGAVVFTACAALSRREVVPYTNRAHWVVLSPWSERRVGDALLAGLKKRRGDMMVGPGDPRRVASDIIRGLPRAFPAASSWSSSHIRDINWRVMVMRQDAVNSYSLPGGQIILYTGLLDHLDTDEEIAVVIAHEVGHAVARHHTDLANVARSVPILRKLLPFSRRKELEADLIGVMLMAAAGFDPRVAAHTYEKLGKIIGGDPVWSDYYGLYPSLNKRIRALSQAKVLEQAMRLYHQQG